MLRFRSSEPFVELLRKPLHSPVYSCKWQWWPLESKAFDDLSELCRNSTTLTLVLALLAY
jgi:hypothetical protein